MIKSDYGHVVVSGSVAQIISETETLLRGVRETLEENRSKEDVKELLMLAVDNSFLSEEERSEKAKKAISDFEEVLKVLDELKQLLKD